MNRIHSIAYLRLSQIIGDKKKHIPALIPIGKTSWWAGIKSGRYPRPIKLAPRTCVWRIDDILAILNRGISTNPATSEAPANLWHLEDILAILNQNASLGPTSTTTSGGHLDEHQC